MYAKTKRSCEEAQKDYTELLENVFKYVCMHAATYTYMYVCMCVHSVCIVVYVYVLLCTPTNKIIVLGEPKFWYTCSLLPEKRYEILWICFTLEVCYEEHNKQY